MLRTILTRLNIMTKILSWSRTVGPLFTVVATIIYHYGSIVFGYNIAVMSLAVFLALGSFAGLRAGLICALWISGYAWLTIPDISRVIQISLGSLAIAVAIGFQARTLRAEHAALRAALADSQAAHVETEAALAREQEMWLKAQEGERAIETLNALNGNIERIKGARDKILNILEKHMIAELTRIELRLVMHTLNNLQFAVEGWQDLAELKERIARQDAEARGGRGDE